MFPVAFPLSKMETQQTLPLDSSNGMEQNVSQNSSQNGSKSNVSTNYSYSIDGGEDRWIKEQSLEYDNEFEMDLEIEFKVPETSTRVDGGNIFNDGCLSSVVQSESLGIPRELPHEFYKRLSSATKPGSSFVPTTSLAMDVMSIQSISNEANGHPGSRNRRKESQQRHSVRNLIGAGRRQIPSNDLEHYVRKQRTQHSLNQALPDLE